MPGNSTRDDYEVISAIGSGSYGTCKKIRRKKDGRIMVWKEMEYGSMSEIEKQMLVSEVNLLKELKHKHIVRYHDRIVDRANSILYMVMEFCDGGDVASLISRLRKESTMIDEDFVWKVCYQTMLALKECHGRQKGGKAILHRDLKPANIFLDSENNVKLGDFGLARVLNHETSFARTFVGTPYYMSPEQMKNLSYNSKSDIWSMGCLLYELCALKPPFTARSQSELKEKICSGRFPRLPSKYSSELNAVISTMLRVDEFKRPSAVQVLDHPRIQQEHQHSICTDVKKCLVSSNGDEGYDSRCNSLTRKEDELKLYEKKLAIREKHILLKEKELKLREQNLEASLKDLEAREKNLNMKSLLVDERLNRVELSKDYAQLKQRFADEKLCNGVLTSNRGSSEFYIPSVNRRDRVNAPIRKCCSASGLLTPLPEHPQYYSSDRSPLKHIENTDYNVHHSGINKTFINIIE